MEEKAYRKGTPWLILGLLLLIVSMGIFVYDLSRDDAEIYRSLQADIEADFQQILRHYDEHPEPSPETDSLARACHLVFDQAGRLKSWSGSQFLPGYNQISRLDYINTSPVWTVGGQSFYVVRHDQSEETRLILIPLSILYQVENEFLQPFFFFGRYHNMFYGPRAGNNILKTVGIPGNSDIPGPVIISDLHGKRALTFQQLPVEPFRQRDRTAVLVFLILGTGALIVYLRIFSVRRWDIRYFINGSLFFGILALRGLLWYVDFPGQYLETGLFSVDVLAFHFLAPSLGEFTFNVAVLAALVWIAYTHFFRISTKLWRKILKNHYVAWLTMLFHVAVVIGLSKAYTEIFTLITNNSQVELVFSNIFSADFFAFLILLDVGLLFFVVMLFSFSLLKLNVVYGQRFGFSAVYWLIHILAALVFSIALYQEHWGLALVMSLAVLTLLIVILRVPDRPILHHDMVNYLLLLGVLSLVVTVHFDQSLENDRSRKARQIAGGVIGRQVISTSSAFDLGIQRMRADTLGIAEASRENKSLEEFGEWIKTTYFAGRMREFELRLFAFDSTRRSLIKSEHEPLFSPNSDLAPGEWGEEVAESFYRLSNSDNRLVDIFVGTFELDLPPYGPLNCYLELHPNSREDDRLYPALTMDQRVYEEQQLINTFDHAIYRDGTLYYESGTSEFPIRLANYQILLQDKKEIVNGYHELIHPIMGSTAGDPDPAALQKVNHVVVRYPVRSLADYVTTFSFIFYFFVLAGVVVIGVPVLALRSLRSHRFTRNLTLRAKIRFSLLTISILPMIFIMVLLSPFIYPRYEAQAIADLLQETERVTKLVGVEYLNFKNDAFSRMTLLQEFRDNVENMGNYLVNDVNIYDEEGKPLASSRSVMYAEGISSDLMNSRALNMLRKGHSLDVVLKEQIGSREYLSGYRAILGRNDQPIGYVNVPYLTQQAELDEQVVDFLAYLANIYLVVFLLINVVAVVISSTITQPLKMIQARIDSTSLGRRNEKIDYEAQDEIGAIVASYNKMIAQLETNEEKIAQTQREMAWKEMARQVAHEIKNPLTPMRLSIQHLTRAWDSGSDKLQELFPKVMKTLVSQIDTMVKIANSFSEFAKMPEASKARVPVNDVLHEVVDLFAQADDLIWLIDIPDEHFITFTDRDQLSRCFNNLLKNAIQAIEAKGETGVIEVTMRNSANRTRIDIMDNGIGMSAEVQSRAFEPSFSTKNSGMGLGLSMVRKIIESSGGEISFVSQEGKGTTFTIELPRIEEAVPVVVG